MDGEERRIYKLEGSIDDEQSRRALEWSMRHPGAEKYEYGWDDPRELSPSVLIEAWSRLKRTKFWSREGRWFHVAMGLYVLACAALVIASVLFQMSE